MATPPGTVPSRGCGSGSHTPRPRRVGSRSRAEIPPSHGRLIMTRTTRPRQRPPRQPALPPGPRPPPCRRERHQGSVSPTHGLPPNRWPAACSRRSRGVSGSHFSATGSTETMRTRRRSAAAVADRWRGRRPRLPARTGRAWSRPRSPLIPSPLIPPVAGEDQGRFVPRPASRGPAGEPRRGRLALGHVGRLREGARSARHGLCASDLRQQAAGAGGALVRALSGQRSRSGDRVGIAYPDLIDQCAKERIERLRCRPDRRVGVEIHLDQHESLHRPSSPRRRSAAG